MVDQQSPFTWISAELLGKIGVDVEKKEVVFFRVNGQTVTRSLGYVILTVENFTTIDQVVFGETDDIQVLGSRTLEGFGVFLNSRTRRLEEFHRYMPFEPFVVVR